MTDDLKKPTPQSSFKPVGTYKGPEPKGTVPVELPPSWAIALGEKIEGISRSQGNLLDNISAFGDRLAKVETELTLARGEVHEIRAWKKSVGDSGAMAPFVRPEGPQTTVSGEVRRISTSDIQQNRAITGLSENQVALSDKVDVIEKKLEDAQNSITSVAETQKAQSRTLTEQNGSLDTIKKDVGGFMARNPALSAALIAFVTTMLTWGTAYLKAKGLQ